MTAVLSVAPDNQAFYISYTSITDHRELVLVKNLPNFNEMQPKPLVP